MKEAQPTRLPKPGEQFYFMISGFMFHAHDDGRGSEISTRGQVVTVTDRLLEANTDTLGNSFLTLLHDADEQIRRWGEIRIAPGEPPNGFTAWTPGTPEQDIARDHARAQAHAIADPDERADALAEVSRIFGVKKTSRTLGYYKQKSGY